MTTTTFAKFYDIRYRRAGVLTDWSKPVRFKAGAPYKINGWNSGDTYNVQARSVSACGAMSAWGDQADLVIPSVSQRVTNDHINTLRTGGIGSAWTGFTISYSCTPTSATISCTAGTLQDGATNPSYGASSAVVSGTASTTVTFYLYYDDPTGTGGSLTLGATTAYSDLSLNQGRVFVGQTVVVFPATGTGSGSGSPGGGGACVCVDMLLLEGLRARDAAAGTTVDGVEYETGSVVPMRVDSAVMCFAPCMRLITESGCVVDASRSTPMTMPDGSLKLLPEMLGELVFVDDEGALRWERVAALYDIGNRPVMLISMRNQCYLAGKTASKRVATHNLIAPKT